MDDLDCPIFDAEYLRKLLTEVRPDISLDDFRFYVVVGDFSEEIFASLLAEILNHGWAALYRDEWNAAVICLTPLGAGLAGVHLSASHPPIWLRDDGYEPPIYAVKEDGFILFTDLDAESAERDTIEFIDDQVDPKQLEPVEVLTSVEEFSEYLLLDRHLPGGQLIPKRNEFLIYGATRIWPRLQESPTRRETPSASTWQALFTQCPFCRHMSDRSECGACRGNAPARRCPDCDGVVMGFQGYCGWCERSGIDHVLPPAEVAQARRKHNTNRKKKRGRQKS